MGWFGVGLKMTGLPSGKLRNLHGIRTPVNTTKIREFSTAFC